VKAGFQENLAVHWRYLLEVSASGFPTPFRGYHTLRYLVPTGIQSWCLPSPRAHTVTHLVALVVVSAGCPVQVQGYATVPCTSCSQCWWLPSPRIPNRTVLCTSTGQRWVPSTRSQCTVQYLVLVERTGVPVPVGWYWLFRQDGDHLNVPGELG
jgi:hypothetical protein